MEKIKAFYLKHKKIILYLFFGVVTTIVSFVSYALFERLFCYLPYTSSNLVFAIAAANVLSWIVAVLFAFVTNKIFVFESKKNSFLGVMGEFASFVGARLLTGFIEWFGVPFLVFSGLHQASFGSEGLLAKIIVSIIVIILNYIFSKILVFRKSK